MQHSHSASAPVDEDKLIKSQMEKIVPTYDAYMRRVTLGRERQLRETTVDLAQVKPGDCLLEVGCGTGSLTLAAKRRAGPSGQAFGIDLIPGMIELSQRKAAEANETITFQVGSMDNIPFPDDQFDVVMGSFMIFHMSDATRRKGLAEAFRVLKPNGRLLFVDLTLPTKTLPRIIAELLFGSFLGPELSELIPLMEAAGFTEIECGPARFSILGVPIIGFVRGKK